MMQIGVPVLFVLVGVLLHALVKQDTVNVFARGLMWAGLFALAFSLASRSFHFG